jgi:4-carboxymuconolactone decarboxylase
MNATMNDNTIVDRSVENRPSTGLAEAGATPAFRSDPTAHREGLALLRKLHGARSGEQLVASLRDICPDFADMTIEWAIQGVMSRPGLDLVTRELLLIAACTTLGFATPQLRAHIEAAASVGATRQQIIETILQMTFYAGGAATSNALRIAAEVFMLSEGREVAFEAAECR